METAGKCEHAKICFKIKYKTGNQNKMFSALKKRKRKQTNNNTVISKCGWDLSDLTGYFTEVITGV